MTTLTAAGVLELWEQAAGLAPGGRALVLAAGCSGIARAVAAELSVGNRDRLLVAAYCGLFGLRVIGRADCPACAEMLELELDLAEFEDEAMEANEPIAIGRFEVRWRLPTAAAVADPAVRSPQDLLRRCIAHVTRDGEPIDSEEWPTELAVAVSAAILAADPLTDVRFALNCVRCEHAWEVGFDPAAFLWAEFDVLARRLLSEVHRLAAAYGWSEAEILKLSAARRAAYLGMCG